MFVYVYICTLIIVCGSSYYTLTFFQALAQWLLARDPTLSTKSLDDNQKNVSTLLILPLFVFSLYRLQLWICLLQVVTTPFPFQAVMKLVLVSFTSGLCLCAIPAMVAIFQSPLKADVLIYSLLFVCALSTVVPLLIRYASSINIIVCFNFDV